MKKSVLVLACLFLIPVFALAQATESPLAEAIPTEETPILAVTSESINAEGRLKTVTAANRSPNKPRGENQSPQLTFTPVDGAECYAILMFDTTANWLHFLVTDVTETTLAQGAYTNTKQYIGPYPPKGTGDHHYRVEVFALSAPPDKASAKMNAQNNYDKIVKSLDTAGGEAGNILLRGFVEGLYAYGDHTAGE